MRDIFNIKVEQKENKFICNTKLPEREKVGLGTF